MGDEPIETGAEKAMAHGQEQDVRKLEEQVAQLQAQERSLKKEQLRYMDTIDELRGASDHWKAVAEELDNKLQSIMESKSWKATESLRQATAFARKLYARTKAVWHSLALRASAFSLNHRFLKFIANFILRKHPHLDTELKAGATVKTPAAREESQTSRTLPPQTGLGPVPVATGEFLSGPELAHLSPQALDIYKKLKAAIKTAQE